MFAVFKSSQKHALLCLSKDVADVKRTKIGSLTTERQENLTLLQISTGELLMFKGLRVSVFSEVQLAH